MTMIVRRGFEYCSILPNESLFFDKKQDNWPLSFINTLEFGKIRSAYKRELKQILFRLKSPRFKNRRCILEGYFPKIIFLDAITYELKEIHVWLDDLQFYRPDFEKKKLFKIPRKLQKRVYDISRD